MSFPSRGLHKPAMGRANVVRAKIALQGPVTAASKGCISARCSVATLAWQDAAVPSLAFTKQM